MPKIIQIKNSKYILIPEDTCLMAGIKKGDRFNITIDRNSDLLLQKIKIPQQ